METFQADVVIIGSGLAALYAAYKLAPQKQVIVLTKEAWTSSNSYLAQGGIAATFAETDDWQIHLEDAIKAGRFHNNQETTAYLVKHSKRTIKDLIEAGVQFDRNKQGEISLAREGGHSASRVLHAGGDATGRRIVETLKARVTDTITIHEHTFAMNLIIEDQRCVGCFALNKENEPVIYTAAHTILATGGAGHVYEPSSNDEAVTGDGLSMAYRAGAELADMEFIQFHPTLLVKDGKSYGLVSEAVRGEGAKLVNQDGERLLEGVHPLEDLAPRDIVARTLYQAKQKGLADTVYLDISMIKDFDKHFPTITSICEKAGVDISEGRIPVAPGHHFSMGGIVTDQNGQSSLNGLWACGEVACTGVHGANRIASHSLLEAVTFADRVSHEILESPLNTFDYLEKSIPEKSTLELPSRKDIEKRMMSNVGIIRDEQTLLEMKNWCEEWIDFTHVPRQLYIGKDEMIRFNMLLTAWLITTSALERTESRGGHFRSDYPNEDPAWQLKQIIRENRQLEHY
ncbi:L-aspartate oxidase [Terrilactibacillus laevilacticus]|uniref:L-aspartate oxidase n=1 Tax=Terrilactibacillus laevilacticus TaxID=1380157 RepID=A0ABW5PSK1_9BACI|nr:L-aspartate oxidase [Terrilactibacillus laevilacticus]